MVKNFSMGHTSKGLVWYSYTTAEGVKVASGGNGPAHAGSFAGALAAAGIAVGGGGDDLAPVVAAHRERLALVSAQCEAHAATIADLRAQLASLQTAGATTLDAAEIARNATETANRASAAKIAAATAEAASLRADLSRMTRDRDDLAAQPQAVTDLAGIAKAQAWLAQGDANG